MNFPESEPSHGLSKKSKKTELSWDWRHPYDKDESNLVKNTFLV